MKKLTLIMIILLVASMVYAANEIRSFNAGATTCYAVIREIDGDVWYVAGQVFEAWGTGARTAADYDIALVDEEGGMFVGTMDTNISAGYYYIISHQQAGGSPADTDPPTWQEYGYWTGTTWINSIDYLNSILEDTGTTLDGIVDALVVEAAEVDANLAAIIVEQAEVDANLVLIVEDTATTIPSAITAAHAITDGLIGVIDGIVDAILTDTAAYDTDAEYATAIWNALIASYGTAGTYGALIEEYDPNITTIVSDVNEIKEDVNDIRWGLPPRTRIGD